MDALSPLSSVGSLEPSAPVVEEGHASAWKDSSTEILTNCLERKINTRSGLKGGGSETEVSPVPRPRRTRTKTEPAEITLSDAAASGERRRSPRKLKSVDASILSPDADNGLVFDETPQSGKRKRPRRTKTDSSVRESQIVEEEDVDAIDEKPRRKRKTPKVTEPVVYDIPLVERKMTTFRGRLGYACLNTVLRKLKPVPIFCSRTCRIDTIEKNGIQFVKNLGLQNAKDLIKLIEWNEDNKIRFMRMSSEMFPFASHEKYGFDLAFADDALKEAGDLAKRLGHRLTMHPGQFTQLASPNPKVVDNSIRELEYHNEMMDRMGLDQDSVMIIHMGGVYGDKPAALVRFRKTYRERLSENVKRRLVLENDELCYNLDDLLPVCTELEIPIVVDYHHDWINPSSRPVTELMPHVNAIWTKKGMKVKQHLSEPRPGAVTVIQKRAHADRCQSLPAGLPDDMDLMIEAKDKEQAVLHLYRVYGLEEVIYENLRPEKPAEEQGLETAGRKRR